MVRQGLRSPGQRAEPTHDELALALRAALDRIVPNLARVAARFVAVRGWVPFGFARVDDFARERLDRSGRWLRDLAALGEMRDKSIALANAFLGRDGGPPIGKVAAVTIGRVASDDSIAAWVERARRVSVRRLKTEARQARQAGSVWPLSDGGSSENTVASEGRNPSSSQDGSATRPEGGSATQIEQGSAPEPDRTFSTAGDFWRSRAADRLGRVRMGMPAPVKIAFLHGHELHRAVCGSDGGVASYVDALVGEAYAGPHPPDPAVGQLPMTRDWGALEALLFENTDQWSHLPQAQLLVDTVVAVREAGSGGPTQLEQQFKTLIELEDQLQRQLGRVLALIGHGRGWATLGFVGLGHYAEQRLGISRTTARDRVRLYRTLWRFPVVREAYETGRIGFESTLLLLRVLGNSGASDQLQQRWVERAAAATVKRLKDEAKSIAIETKTKEPLSDEQWFASLRREPGDTGARIRRLGLDSLSAEVETDSLRLTLPEDLAVDFLAAVEGWRGALETGAVAEGTVAGQVARVFSEKGRGVPQWVGLLAMVEDFVATWDDPDAMPRRKADRIYARDGWRCTAPGCSSRRNLESHHLVYRSRGGSQNEESNQVTACRFHHQMGEHGALASCRGAAPLRVDWRLGREGLASRYRNEIRVGVD